MKQSLYLSLARRFASTIKQEGVRPAMTKARLYVARRAQGIGASDLNPSLAIGGSTESYLQGIWAEMARGGGFHVARDHTRPPRIALIGDLNLPQCRKYRIEQLADFWRAQGVECDYAHYGDITRSTQLLQNATHLCEYRLEAMPLTQMYRYEARRLGLPVLYDIDDPLFSVSAYETYKNMAALDPGMKAHFLSVAPRYAEMMNSADIVTVSTPGLVEHARLYTARPVHMRRNFADETTLSDGKKAMNTVREAEDDGLFRLVFASGSQGHEADFEVVADAIADFIISAPDRRLRILGHFRTEMLPPALRDRTEHYKFLPYEAYLTHLAAADVAVMPLQDDIFNRCKSAVRVIDAASVGLTSVVSDVGDLQCLVEDGVTGYIARCQTEWHELLKKLVNNRARTREMGRAARAKLETQWVGRAAPHIVDQTVLDWIET